MLPQVDAEERGLAVGQRAVLIGGGDQLQALVLGDHNPKPSASENAHGALEKFFLGLVFTAEKFAEGFHERSTFGQRG